ncbi:MAG TPA: hypothetical protein VGF96_18745 [Terracidiphilus sp.]|jgi:hypothetical protein
MKGTSLALCTILFAAPIAVYAGEQIVPAGSLINCTVSEPKLSSKTTNIGDPVLCQLGMTERYGRSVLPYNSYLVGRFEDYRDPGHFVGKGWMELRFDRMVIEPDTVIPVDARVVDVPGYNVDRYGRILGKGHPVRDTVTWLIPILWPIDLINLPRRGPRPTLKEETRLTLKVMDDLAVPMNDRQMPQQDPNGLYQRPSAYQPPPPPPQPEPQQAPVAMDYSPAPPPPPVMAYVPVPSPPPAVYYYPPPSIFAPMMPPRRAVIVMRGGFAYRVYVP